jgi:hypothetical protein
MNENGRGRPIQFDVSTPLPVLSPPITVAAIEVFIAYLAAPALGWLLADLVSGDQKRASEAARTAAPRTH